MKSGSMNKIGLEIKNAQHMYSTIYEEFIFVNTLHYLQFLSQIFFLNHAMMLKGLGS